MKKLALSLLILASTSHAKEMVGIGEYRFGPDTPTNVACEMAEERAKENAIAKFSGEDIDAVTFADCHNESCDVQRETINRTKGYIKNVLRKTQRTNEMQGYTSCVVTLFTEVEKVKDEIRLKLTDDSYNFKERDEVNFRAVPNKPGYLALYNYYNGVYRIVDYQTVAQPEKEVVIPSSRKRRIVATLPAGELQSKELVVFLYTENWVDLKEVYTQAEYKNMLSKIPPHQRDVVNRYVYIVR